MKILALSHVVFDYPRQAWLTRDRPVLDQVSLQVKHSEMLHIQGANGSGKTTLLRILAGLLQPTDGNMTYGGQDIWTDITNYQRHLCYVGHKNGINPGLTVWEHSQLDWLLPRQERDIEADLKALSLWSVKHRLYHLLSAGQKRRLALLRLLRSSAQLWLLDEPMVALDSAGVAWLVSCLSNHIAQGGQVVYSSHQALVCNAADYKVYQL